MLGNNIHFFKYIFLFLEHGVNNLFSRDIELISVLFSLGLHSSRSHHRTCMSAIPDKAHTFKKNLCVILPRNKEGKNRQVKQLNLFTFFGGV